MNRNYTLAYTARRVRALNEQLPEVHRADLEAEWLALEESIAGLSDARVIAVVDDWRFEMEVRLSNRLLAAPLKGQAA